MSRLPLPRRGFDHHRSTQVRHQAGHRVDRRVAGHGDEPGAGQSGVAQRPALHHLVDEGLDDLGWVALETEGGGQAAGGLELAVGEGQDAADAGGAQVGHHLRGRAPGDVDDPAEPGEQSGPDPSAGSDASTTQTTS